MERVRSGESYARPLPEQLRGEEGGGQRQGDPVRRLHPDRHQAGPGPGVFDAPGDRGDGQLIRRLAGRRQQRHIDAVHRSGGGPEEAPKGRGEAPEGHGVPDEPPVLPDGGKVAEHHRQGDGQLFRAAEPGHGGEEFVDPGGDNEGPRQHPAGVDLMEQPQKGHEHGPNRAGHGLHGPEGEQANQDVGSDAPEGVSSSPADGGENPDEDHQGQGKGQVRCEHGAENAEEQQSQLGAGIKVQGLHLVIPAFSNCFFSILPPTKALRAAARTVPASMATRIQAVPVERMVSM